MRDYEALKFEASVLYIKDGLSAYQICERLSLSMPTLKKWNDAGRWRELRPDMERLSQYKAADMYIVQGFDANKISQLLSVSEMTVNMWIDFNGWNTAKKISQAQNTAVEIVESFCEYFKSSFPNNSSLVEYAKISYLKTIK